jgi:hypothetical protein
MMRLAQRFGTDVYDELIKTWLPVGDSLLHGDGTSWKVLALAWRW